MHSIVHTLNTSPSLPRPHSWEERIISLLAFDPLRGCGDSGKREREATAKVQLYLDLSWRVWPDWAEVRGEGETHHQFIPLLSRLQDIHRTEFNARIWTARRARAMKAIPPRPRRQQSAPLRARGPCLHCIGINGLDIPQSRGQEKRNVRNLGRARQSRRAERRGRRRDFAPPIVLVLVAKIKRRLGGVNSRTHTHTHSSCFSLADQR